MSQIVLEPQCRVCLNYTTKVINIFNTVPHLTSSFTAKIYCVIMECAPVQIVEGDGLPQFICHSCVAKLDVAYRFRERCVQSDAYLRTLPPLVTINFPDHEEKPHAATANIPIICDVCGFSAPNRNQFKEHRKIHTDESKHSCEQCPKRFMTLRGLDKHKQQQHSISTNPLEIFECSTCNQLFKNKNLLKIHTRTHLNECSLCDKKFVNDSELNEHILMIHSGIKPFKCNYCDKSFIKKIYVQRHERQHTGVRPFKCDICEKTFTLKTNLKIHRKMHTGERPFKCNICEKRFIATFHLEEHLRSHTGERPFECEFCKKKFSQNSYLKKHLAMHTGQSMYTCKICEKVFVTQGCLTRHLRLHSGNRPYKCDICNKCFNESVSLKAHVRTHTGEKPFRCEFCDRRFVTKRQLKRHVKLQHKCPSCDLYFLDRASYDSHIAAHAVDVATIDVPNIGSVVEVVDLKIDGIDLKNQDTWIAVQYI